VKIIKTGSGVTDRWRSGCWPVPRLAAEGTPAAGCSRAGWWAGLWLEERSGPWLLPGAAAIPAAGLRLGCRQL